MTPIPIVTLNSCPFVEGEEQHSANQLCIKPQKSRSTGLLHEEFTGNRVSGLVTLFAIQERSSVRGSRIFGYTPLITFSWGRVRHDKHRQGLEEHQRTCRAPVR
jgi:hypothetical protein